MRARLWLSVVMLLAGVGLAAAAGFAGPEPTKGGTLRISEPFDVGSLDPALAYRTETFGVIEFATCAKLYSYPDKPAPQGAIVIPEVAKGFPKLSKDGKTQTIELRPTYRFHTGRRITAANFVAAFNRDASPKLQSPATAYLHEIVGADAVIDGKARTIAGVRALSPYRLQIRTNPRPPDCAQAQPLLSRSPAREGRPSCVDDRRGPRGLPARGRTERDGLLRDSPSDGLQADRQQVRDQQKGRAVLFPPGARDRLLCLQPRPARVQGAGPDSAQAGDQLGDRPACNCGRGRLPGRHAHRPDPAAGHGSECEHLPARGRHPGKAGKGTGPPRQGEVQAREAGALHEQRALLCLRSADLAVQPQAARDRRRGPVLLDSSRARESRYPRGTL